MKISVYENPEDNAYTKEQQILACCNAFTLF